MAYKIVSVNNAGKVKKTVCKEKRAFLHGVNEEAKQAIRILTGTDEETEYDYHYLFAAFCHTKDNTYKNPYKALYFNGNSHDLMEKLKNRTANHKYTRYISLNPYHGIVLPVTEFNDRREAGFSLRGYFAEGGKKNRAFHFNACAKTLFGYSATAVSFQWNTKTAALYNEKIYNYVQDIEKVLEENNIPVPTFINFTGCTLQFVYCFNLVTKDFEWMYKRTADALIGCYQKLIIPFMSIGDPALDRTVTEVPCSLIKLPGSYDATDYVYEKTSCRIIKEEKYTLQNLCYALYPDDEDLRKIKRKRVTIERNKYRYAANEIRKREHINDVTYVPMRDDMALGKYKDAMDYRLSAVSRKLDTIKNENIKLSRQEKNDFLFVSYNTLVPTIGRKKAKEKIQAFIEKNEYTKKQINSLFSESKNNNGYNWYWFKNDEFFNFFGMSAIQIRKRFSISNHEADMHEKYKSELRAKTAKRKHNRNIRIIETYIKTKNIKKTAQLCNCARNTIYTVLKDNATLVNNLSRGQKMVAERKLYAYYKRNKSHELGKKGLEFAAKLGLDKEDAEEIISSLDNLRNYFYNSLFDLQFGKINFLMPNAAEKHFVEEYVDGEFDPKKIWMNPHKIAKDFCAALGGNFWDALTALAPGERHFGEFQTADYSHVI